MLKQALLYARNGLEILPLQANKKIPFKTDCFPNGFKSATASFEKIQKHWREHPDSNIGIKIGTSLVILDVDVHKDNGFISLEVLENKFGSLPETFSVNTPTGGKHYYFRLPRGIRIERQINAFKGIDILTNGYVVASPSMINEKGYEVATGSINDIAILPDWLLNTFKTYKPNTLNHFSNSFRNTKDKKYTGAFLDEIVAGSSIGNRNDWMMKQISKMLALGAELDTIYKLTLVINENFLDEPLPLGEINATFKSRVKKHTGRKEW